MKQNYITAVLEKIQNGDEPADIFSGLKKTLKKHGHERLYASILSGVARVLESSSTDTTVITVANTEAYTKQKNAIEKALKDLNTTTEPKVVFDEKIVGGFVAEANNMRLDKSYKTKLVTLYRSLTK